MSSDAQDDQPHHPEDRKRGTEEPPSDNLWRLAFGLAELGALYFSHKGNEGAAQIAHALALVIQMSRRSGSA